MFHIQDVWSVGVAANNECQQQADEFAKQMTNGLFCSLTERHKSARLAGQSLSTEACQSLMIMLGTAFEQGWKKGNEWILGQLDVDHYENNCGERDAPESNGNDLLNDKHIWSVRARKAFVKLGLTSVADLKNTTIDDFVCLKNVGITTIGEIKSTARLRYGIVIPTPPLPASP